MPGRERSRIRIASRKPLPSSPIRASAGTRQPLRKISPVVEPLIPIFGSIRPTSNPGASASTAKAEMPAVARRRVRLREDDVDAGDAGVRDEALRPVEDVLVAVAARLRPHRGRVGAGAGLGQRIRSEHLAAREPRQVAPLLLLVARQLERERAQLLHRRGSGRSSRTPSRSPRPRPTSRARSRPRRRTPRRRASRRCRSRGRARRCPTGTPRPVDLRRPRRDALARERPHEVADRALLGGQQLVRHAPQSRFDP